MAISIGMSMLSGGLSSFKDGGSFLEGAIDGFADGVFWGGVFAAVSAGIHAIKYGATWFKTHKLANVGNYDELAKMFTHNKFSRKVMLGKWDGGGPTSYVARAGKEYTYFSMPSKIWNSLSKKIGTNMWEINKAFLNQQIIAGKSFFSSHIVQVLGDDFLSREIRHLAKMGIKPTYLPFGG